MKGQLFTAVEGNQRGNGDQAAVSGRQPRALPYIAKQHLFGHFCEFGGQTRHGIECQCLGSIAVHIRLLFISVERSIRRYDYPKYRKYQQC
ncbi:hypothetical protein D3C80_1804270 [compost metagenome]